MQFSANQFRIKRKFPRSTLVALVCAIVASGIAVFSFIQARENKYALESSKVELRAARAKISELGALLASAKHDHETQLVGTKEICNSGAAELKTQVAAFAKQAAACEKIRTQIAFR